MKQPPAALWSRTGAQRPRKKPPKKRYGADPRFRRRRLVAAVVVATCLLAGAGVALLFFSGLANVCLLYTSPSPRDKRQSRMPSSA